jgi:adenylate kinase family enzyme
MSALGKKIVVIGVSASGKSVFARKLAAKTGLPIVFVDTLMWKPGWNYIGDEETAKLLDNESANSQWIIEGYIVKPARPFIFERADTIMYLDYSPWVASWRYLKRWWMHRNDPRLELPGCPEKFSFKFLKLVWSKGETISLNKFLENSLHQHKVIRLHSPKAAKNFLQANA